MTGFSARPQAAGPLLLVLDDHPTGVWSAAGSRSGAWLPPRPEDVAAAGRRDGVADPPA
jgi:hypothetical protein